MSNLDLAEDRPLEKLPWLQDIDSSLCSTVHIAKTEGGRWLLLWEHRHPELGTYDEYFGDEDGERDEYGLPPLVKRTEERLAEWQYLRDQLSSRAFSKEITREQAWKTVAYFSLDEEWHRDAGIF